MPLEWVAMRCAAQNHMVKDSFERCITVPAVTDVWRPQPRHSYVCARLFSRAARPPPQAGQTKPSGQRRSNRKVAQLVSSGKLVRNSFRDRALATESSPRAVAARESYLTTCSVTWDNGISLPTCNKLTTDFGRYAGRLKAFASEFAQPRRERQVSVTLSTVVLAAGIRVASPGNSHSALRKPPKVLNA